MRAVPLTDKTTAMSEYRVEKVRADAELTLTTGRRVKGCFFVWAASQTHPGPERVADLLNEQTGFFPFEIEDGDTAVYNRAHVVVVRLSAAMAEARLEPGYEVAKRRQVSMLLSTGDRVVGTVSLYQPSGRDRLSDYARGGDVFRYVETRDHTLIVNSAHLVELQEIAD